MIIQTGFTKTNKNNNSFCYLNNFNTKINLMRKTKNQHQHIKALDDKEKSYNPIFMARSFPNTNRNYRGFSCKIDKMRYC